MRPRLRWQSRTLQFDVVVSKGERMGPPLLPRPERFERLAVSLP
jgi:hypothetical protein